MSWFARKKKQTIAIDLEVFEPAIRCSICTGEKVAGFRNKEDGTFQEVMLIQSQKDLQSFIETYGLQGVKIKEFY